MGGYFFLPVYVLCTLETVAKEMTQAQKFDKEGTYIRKFVPEIAKLPNKFIFNPWLADKQTLKDSNVELGINYPFPIIDYTLSRSRALEAFKKI